jgi:GT2 family glycosyltransferase
VSVHIVAVLYNSAASLPGFADCLANQTADWHLVAIDNASGDGGAELLEQRGDPRIAVRRNTRNLGFARAANQGLRDALAAGAEFVVLLNTDVALPPDFLARFAQRRAALNADAIAPRIMRMDPRNEADAWYAGGHFDNAWVFRTVHEPYDPAGPTQRIVSFASGCCLGLTRAVLERVGLLDERFFVYWEDADYCLRLRHAGVAIHYVADIAMWHEGGHASGGETSAAYNRLYWRGYTQVLRKHFGWTTAFATALRVALKELGRPGPLTPARRALLAGLARGLLG